MTADTDIELNFGKPIPKAEAASYPSVCVGLLPFKINENTPEAKTLIRWDFSLDGTEDPDFPGTPVIIDGVTSTATGPRSKMRPWVQALIGRPLRDDERLTLTELNKMVLGRPCVTRVGINDSGYSKVEDVLPPMRQPARPAAPAPTPAAPPPPETAHPGQPDRGEASVIEDLRRDAVAQPMTALPNMAEPEGPTSLPRDPDETTFR